MVEPFVHSSSLCPCPYTGTFFMDTGALKAYDTYSDTSIVPHSVSESFRGFAIPGMYSLGNQKSAADDEYSWIRICDLDIKYCCRRDF